MPSAQRTDVGDSSAAQPACVANVPESGSTKCMVNCSAQRAWCGRTVRLGAGRRAYQAIGMQVSSGSNQALLPHAWLQLSAGALPTRWPLTGLPACTRRSTFDLARWEVELVRSERERGRMTLSSIQRSHTAVATHPTT